MSNQKFYIGWQEGLPPKSKMKVGIFISVVVVGIVILAVVLVINTHPFNDHNFELGAVKEFSGVFYSQPFPVLILDKGQSPIDGVNEALLVGYGKNGAMTFISPVEAELGGIQGKRIHITGTLIYGDGKVLIELTEKEESILEVDNRQTEVVKTSLSEGRLEGEVLDPKCWFGVMKPGEGKVHKSCAIRCISGGIPPVLRMKVNGKNEYFLVLGPEGQPLSDDVLNYVGEEVIAFGQVFESNGWKYIQTDPATIKFLR